MASSFPFTDRADGGRVLADALALHVGGEDVTVLALPNDGVPVAVEVAHALEAPLDVLVTQRIAAPGHEDVTLGLMAYPQAIALRPATLGALALPDDALRAALVRAHGLLRRRLSALRPPGAAPPVAGRTVVLVADTVGHGLALSLAAQLARRAGARRVVAAAPGGSRVGLRALVGDCDEVVCPRPCAPPDHACHLYADGGGPVREAEVHALLARAWAHSSAVDPNAGVAQTAERDAYGRGSLVLF